MWEGRKVLVTGGASFIGSHLVRRLIELEAKVLVVDNMSSGKLDNLPVYRKGLDFRRGDLRTPQTARAAMVDREVVFHLAANHGGRGYVDTHEIQCAGNMILDQVVLHAASESRHVKYVVYASSACVYPMFMQDYNYVQDGTIRDTLEERHVGPPYDADHMYGWAKLMGEMLMEKCIDAEMFHGTSLRYFTVYGPRMTVSHAIGAWIAKARAHRDPFIIWGDGEQTRSWIYVDDVVEATIAAAENIIMDKEVNSGDMTPPAINVGSPQHVKVIDAALLVLGAAERREGKDWPGVRIAYDVMQPQGPRHRAADIGLAEDALSWKPSRGFADGIGNVVDWFYDKYTREQAERLLMKLKER